MTRKRMLDPYQTAIDQFNRYGVRYVVVGMSGINYYAKNTAQAFATLDYDLFLEPTIKNVSQAVQCLTKLDFTIGTSTGPLAAHALKGVVHDQKTLTATTPQGVSIELLLKISGYPFSEIAKDAATFTVQGVPVRVGRLKKLLRSKRLADRPKDRQFLRRYESVLEEDT